MSGGIGFRTPLARWLFSAAKFFEGQSLPPKRNDVMIKRLSALDEATGKGIDHG